MRHEKIEGTTHIYMEEDETEEQVLRAIVKASFELARPAGRGWAHFNSDQEMTDEVADKFITPKGRATVSEVTSKGLVPRPDLGGVSPTVVNMDYFEGRQCKTRLSRVDVGHFELDNFIYERDRGTPKPMLERAKDILVGKKTAGLASTSYMYKGEDLTRRLKEHGFTRKNGESDWEFRKRVFPEFFQQASDSAMEFLMGGSAVEWDDVDQMLCILLVKKDRPSHAELVKFARGLAYDPLIMRERRQAASSN